LIITTGYRAPTTLNCFDYNNHKVRSSLVFFPVPTHNLNAKRFASLPPVSHAFLLLSLIFLAPQIIQQDMKPF
jgi:hypothetical protein